jgi:hypothetical protein
LKQTQIELLACIDELQPQPLERDTHERGIDVRGWCCVLTHLSGEVNSANSLAWNSRSRMSSSQIRDVHMRDQSIFGTSVGSFCDLISGTV